MSKHPIVGRVYKTDTGYVKFNTDQKMTEIVTNNGFGIIFNRTVSYFTIMNDSTMVPESEWNELLTQLQASISPNTH